MGEACRWSAPRSGADVRRRWIPSLPEVRMACDRVLVAIGQGIESPKFRKSTAFPSNAACIDGALTGAVMQRHVTGVFAGGDCVTGPATVIRAIAAGKVAAANIDEYLGFHHEH